MKKIIFIMLLFAVSVFAQQNMSGNITQPVNGSFYLAPNTLGCLQEDRLLFFGPTCEGCITPNNCVRSDFFEANGMLDCSGGDYCNLLNTLENELAAAAPTTTKEQTLLENLVKELDISTDCLIGAYNGSLVNETEPEELQVGSKTYFNTIKPCYVRTIAALGMLEQIYIDEVNASFLVQKLQAIEEDYQHLLAQEDITASKSFNISKATLTGTVTGGGVQPVVEAQEARDVVLTNINSYNDSMNVSTFNFTTDSKTNSSIDLVGYLVFVNVVGDPNQMQGTAVTVPNNCNEERSNVFIDIQTGLEFYQSVVTCQNGYPGGLFSIAVNGGDYLPYALVSVVPDYSSPENTASINGEIAISISEQSASGLPANGNPNDFVRVDGIGIPLFSSYVKDEREANIFFGDFNASVPDGVSDLSVNNERGPICTELLVLASSVSPLFYNGPIQTPPLIVQSPTVGSSSIFLFGAVVNAGDPTTTPLANRQLFWAMPFPTTAVIIGSACSAADIVPGNNEVTVSNAMPIAAGGYGFTLGSTPTGFFALNKAGDSSFIILACAALLTAGLFLYVLAKKKSN